MSKIPTVKVTAPKGLTLRAPVMLQLTKQQYDARAGVLGAYERRGRYRLDRGEVTFKQGEVFGLHPLAKAAEASVEVIDAAPGKPEGGDTPADKPEGADTAADTVEGGA